MSMSIEEIEGIGPKYSDMLKAAGVVKVSELLAAGGAPQGRMQLAQRSGINETLILKWVNMSDLFRIRGVASQMSELLEASGVDTVKELRHRNSQNLVDKMHEVNAEKQIVKKVPSVTQIADWIEQAKTLQPLVSY